MVPNFIKKLFDSSHNLSKPYYYNKQRLEIMQSSDDDDFIDSITSTATPVAKKKGTLIDWDDVGITFSTYEDFMKWKQKTAYSWKSSAVGNIYVNDGAKQRKNYYNFKCTSCEDDCNFQVIIPQQHKSHTIPF